MAEVKEEKVEKVEIKSYATKNELLEFFALNRGKNFMVENEIRDIKTGELIGTENKIIYEKRVDLETKYIIERYDENLIYRPETNKDVVIIMKRITPDIDDDDFTVRTAKGSTKRPVNDLR